MTFIAAGVGFAAVGAASNIIGGISKDNAAKKLAANNKRPWYNIPTEYQENDNLAAGQAETGLSPSSINYYSAQSNRGLGSGIGAIEDGGGDVDTLSKLYDSFSQGLSSTANEDSQLKTQHLQTFLNANKDLAGQKTQQWALNYYEPYKDTAQLASAEKNAGQQQIQTGIGEGVGALGTLAKANVFGGSGGSSETAGAANGTSDLTSVTPSSPSFTTPSLSSGIPSFNTQGGQAVMANVGKTDASSPQLAQLLQLFNANSPQLAT